MTTPERWARVETEKNEGRVLIGDVYVTGFWGHDDSGSQARAHAILINAELDKVAVPRAVADRMAEAIRQRAQKEHDKGHDFQGCLGPKAHMYEFEKDALAAYEAAKKGDLKDGN